MPLVKQRVLAAMHDARFSGPQALALKAGIAVSTIHRIGQGKGPPDTKTLEAIARETGKSVDWLLGHDEPVPPVDLASAIKDLVDELRSWRTEDRTRLAQVEAMVDQLVAESLGGPGTPAATERPVPPVTVE